MKDLSLLEQQLRSWTPRRPSDKIRVALAREMSGVDCGAVFGGDCRRRIVLSWLAPAVSCAAAILILAGLAGLRWSQPGGVFSVASLDLSPLYFSMEERGLDPAFAFHGTEINLEWNICSRASFEWTNINQSPSSKDSLPLAKTNRLML